MFHRILGKEARPKIKLHVEKIFLGVCQTQGKVYRVKRPTEDNLWHRFPPVSLSVLGHWPGDGPVLRAAVTLRGGL